jgi:hypothetical protein
MTVRRAGRVAGFAFLLGAAIAVALLFPLPPATDIDAARRWGVGAGYIGFFLGFPLSLGGMPLAVALHPYPVGDDTTGASTVVAMIAGIVGFNWAVWAAFWAILISRVRRGRTSPRAKTS